MAGDGSEYRYDGESMASKGIVAVTVNYRLTVFGSLAHPELTAEAPYHASGNYGFLDQNAALKWVRTNDPNGAELPNWLSYAPDTGFKVMDLDIHSSATPEARQRSHTGR